MSDYYVPPFDLTEEITALTLEICQLLGKYVDSSKLSKDPMLRKTNRIRSIHSSLAIEHNSLTQQQVTALLNGQPVIGPKRDIDEVLNANQVYDLVETLRPYSVEDLLQSHSVMMGGIASDAGHFRAKGVGVYKGTQLIHMGTRPEMVPSLMGQLMEWAHQSKIHPLIKSCIFHYEFVYIHPFSDGNGRTARFWHTLMLSKWEPLFAWLPIESLIYRRQSEYYDAIAASNAEGKSTVFISFMLHVIKDVLQQNVQLGLSDMTDPKDRILSFLKSQPKASAKQLALELGLSSRHVERLLSRLKEEGKLQRLGPNRNGTWMVLE